MFDQIPAELKKLKQWCTFDVVDGKKIPFVAGNCAKASSNNETTWRSFEEAVADIESGKRQHLGFAFSASDPYFFVDLDEEHPEIVAALPTYTQRSVSGKGVHLIGRGSFEGPGTHPSTPAIGIYQESRFCLFTGDCIGETEILEVDNKVLQGLYDWVSGNKKSTTTDLVEVETSEEDKEVFERCKNRFDTFLSLYAGNAGPDHSESDHALIAMLADESQSNEQVRRMFMASALCRPRRAKDDYIDRSLVKCRAKQENLSKLMEAFNDYEEEPEEENEEKFKDIGDRNLIDSLPPGLIREIADWHWRQALYPLQECSVAVACSVIATVAGRSFQTLTRSGINPWIILLAETSWGKNEYSNGISSIFGKVDAANTYGHTKFSRMLGGTAASGEGLEDNLLVNSRINSYFPEFDTIFKSLTAQQSASHLQSLTRLLLDLYGRSGEDAFLKKRFKARAKDDKESPVVQAPCLVVSGETIGKKLYSHMDIADAESGFLQRFSLFEAKRSSVSLLMNSEQGFPMADTLLDRLLELFTYCDQLTTENRFITVEATEEAKNSMYAYANLKRRESLSSNEEAIKQLLNRAGFKVFKFASLFAVAANFNNPIVTQQHVDWAISFVNSCDESLLKQFTSGSIGSGQIKQESEIIRVIRDALGMSVKKRIALGIPKKIALSRNVVPYNWLKRKVSSANAFATDRSGALTAFDRMLNSMVKAGVLTYIDPVKAEENYNKGCGAMVGVNE